jgi:outer membrane protein assembly factor BamB
VTAVGGIAPVGKLIAFSAETGKQIWEAPAKEVYNAPVDVLVAGGLIWTGNMVQRNDPGITVGRDPNTGEIKRTRPKDSEQFKYGPVHHRCYRNKATDKYLVLGRDGIEFINIATGQGMGNSWTRGACQYGVMPCNGLVYIPPHSCACHIEYKLSHFNVLAPASSEPKTDSKPKLEKGPAFGKVSASKTQSGWATYRGDVSRSGSAKSAVSPKLTNLWTTKIASKLSTVTVASGKLFVAAIDEHAVHCLDAKTGRSLWKFVAGGRIDSPPTIWNNRAIFGCADGRIYCLRVSDGQLAWRFSAGGSNQRIVSYGQLESVRPISGSVMIAKGAVYAVAGRSTFLDGGLTLYRLDAETGKMLSAGPVETAALPDVLSSDGESVFMRDKRFDMNGTSIKTPATHLYSSAGFLDGQWWHRTYWQVGARMLSTWGGWSQMGNRVPSGRLLVLDKENIYGYGRLNQYHRDGAHVGMGKTKYKLFACNRFKKTVKPAPKPKTKRRRAAPKVAIQWSCSSDVMVRAMVLTGQAADKTLFIAGPPNVITQAEPKGLHAYTLKSPKALEEQRAAIEGKRGGSICAISASDGKPLGKITVSAPPVWDGLAADNGRIYLAATDGTVSCYTGKK